MKITKDFIVDILKEDYVLEYQKVYDNITLSDILFDIEDKYSRR